MRRHLIRLASAPFTLLSFSKVWLGSVCRVQRSRTENLRWVGENSGPILTHYWVKVHEVFRHIRRLLVLSNPLAQLSISRFIQKVFAVKSRNRQQPNKFKSFLAPIFWDGRPRLFYDTLLARITVWQSLVEFRLLISVCKAWQRIRV